MHAGIKKVARTTKEDIDNIGNLFRPVVYRTFFGLVWKVPLLEPRKMATSRPQDVSNTVRGFATLLCNEAGPRGQGAPTFGVNA